MKTFRGTNTRTPKPEDYETPKGKSLTIQDDSYTVKRIIESNMTGIPLTSRKAIWGELEEDDFEAEDLEELQRLDHDEKFRIHGEHLEKVKKVKNSLKNPPKDEPKKDPE